MELNAGGDPDARKIAGMYKEYQSILRGNNALDFDDLIVKTVELFQHNTGYPGLLSGTFQIYYGG